MQEKSLTERSLCHVLTVLLFLDISGVEMG